ncbi:Cna B-type domain-containing protein, partial [Melissococcus plutonius]|uniref:Cna B-type domain-containing protein n=1 Tax=Melissococcus plutonius TaxID=33970 RepID=UPI003C2F89DA
MRKILKLVTIISLVISSFPVGLLTDANETNAETAETVQTTTKTDGISEAEQSAKMDGTSETAQITKTDGTSETTQSVETAEIPKKVNRENFLDYFQLGGVSTYDKGTGIVTLTPNKSHQVGNVTLKQRFHSHTSFDLKGAIYLGDKLDSEGGADGIGFAIHPNAIGSVGYAGANLGIGGLPNAVGFKLDTFYNGKQTPDPNASDDVHKLGWDADPIRGQNNPFGAIVHTDAKGYVTTETKDVKLLDKKQVLNKAIKREETDGGYDALLAKGENEKGFVPIDFDYDSNSHILTVTFGVQKWQTKIDSAESLATSVSGSTGLFRNLQEFRFDSASYVKATNIKVNKVWKDNNNQDGIRPDSVLVNLLQNGKFFQSYSLKSSENWEHTFDNLVAEDLHGNKFTYSIEEASVPSGYTSSKEGNTIINTHPIKTTTVSGIKIWDDDNNHDGTRPDKITIHLMANGKEVNKKEVTAKDNWKYSFTDLPENEAGKAIKYTVKEDQVPGYETSYEGNNVVNKHPSAKTEVSGSKIWEDNNNQDGTRPDKITVHLMANDKEVDKKEVTAKDSWKYSFTDLPKNEAGKAIQYKIKEDQVPGYETSYEGNNVVNKHPSAKTEVSGAKIWEDNNDQDGTRPDRITVHLMANDKEVDKKEVTAKDNWKYSFTDLPKNEAGKAIQYRIKEDQVPGYETSYEGNNVVNKHPSAKTEVSGAKIWEDNNNQDGTRPDKITVHLMANDKEVNKKEITSKDNWKYSFTDLPKNEAGKAIKYTVKEDQVPGYETSYEGNNVVNKHPAAKTEVSGAKIWEDNNNQDGTRPDKITVHLMANDKEVNKK